VDKIQNLLNKYNENKLFFWHHVDAAYGGYFASAVDKKQLHSLYLSPEVENAFRSLKNVQSITIDPHKLGYIPYACGAFLAKNSDYYKVSAFEAKYIQSPTKTIDRWMKTLEGSRSAQGATATWLSSKALGLHPEGHGLILGRTIKARIILEEKIKQQCPNMALLEKNDLNLLCMINKGSAISLSDANEKTEKLIELINQSNSFIVSKTTLKSPEYQNIIDYHCEKWNIKNDSAEIVLLRLTLMNPFFHNNQTNVSFIDEFANKLNELSC
jgi:glutamate/tyrosine decarboxylase-like PLP-dependent enzyme